MRCRIGNVWWLFFRKCLYAKDCDSEQCGCKNSQYLAGGSVIQGEMGGHGIRTATLLVHNTFSGDSRLSLWSQFPNPQKKKKKNCACLAAVRNRLWYVVVKVILDVILDVILRIE